MVLTQKKIKDMAETIKIIVSSRRLERFLKPPGGVLTVKSSPFPDTVTMCFNEQEIEVEGYVKGNHNVSLDYKKASALKNLLALIEEQPIVIVFQEDSYFTIESLLFSTN